jgi:hypothetical protein
MELGLGLVPSSQAVFQRSGVTMQMRCAHIAGFALEVVYDRAGSRPVVCGKRALDFLNRRGQSSREPFDQSGRQIVITHATPE